MRKAPVLTTRQKLAAAHVAGRRDASAGGAHPADLAAKPLRFQRNVFGQAIVQHDDDDA